ncbi:MAG: zinc metallopeptidase [Lachnospiraceae bacterium]|nr:zinc metallopeptidase [Lachnospiraceae bacterium]
MPLIPFFDPTYILVLIGAGICLIASHSMKKTFEKYGKIRSGTGMTGREVAERLLRAGGIHDVQVRHVSGNLSDHYDPRNKTLNLSDATYGAQSVAAIGVAAHECGHAMQDNTAYVPLGLRSALVPVANFGSMAAWPVIILGLFIDGDSSIIFMNIGIILFSAAVLFQIVTLPVEFNASRRALKALDEQAMLSTEELGMARKVLSAAALTYVAGAAAMILQMLRLVLLRDRRR